MADSIKYKLLTRIVKTENDSRSVFPRLIVGLIFLSEGIQKFLFPELVGTGRFETIGFPNAAFWAYVTATLEVICGLHILSGLFTRLAAIPLLMIMITAFVATKLPILINKGFWVMAHEYRTDFAMTLLLIYLLVYGAGRWSADLLIFKRSRLKMP